MANTPVSTAPVGAELDSSSYVDWPAIIAGIVLASAISILLLTFASAIGFTFADFDEDAGSRAIWLGIAAGLWLLWVQISSFMAGGYLTGRLRRRRPGATTHESVVRDGAHGLLVWAGALVVGALIAVSGISTAATTIGNAVGTATVAASNTAEGQLSLDPSTYYVDSLFRGGNADAETIGEAGRIVAFSGDDAVESGDSAYLAELVAANTSLSEEEAAQRVDTVLAQWQEAKETAAAAADTARKVGVIAAFLTAAAFLISAVGAHWAASMGGRHRDEGTEFPFFARW